MKQVRGWIALLGLAMLLFSVAPASAIPYTPFSGWQLFSTSAEAPAPFTTFGLFGGMTDFNGDPDNDPFTFDLASPGILRLTDFFQTGDRFMMWDFGVCLGATTPSVWFDGPVETDPDIAYASGGLGGQTYSTTSKIVPVELAAGAHSLQFQNLFFRNGAPQFRDVVEPPLFSDANFRVDPVPEPATMALLGLGLAVAGLVIRRKR